ncbi:MAG: PAS domain-containing sensor histidine kinase [Hyphomonadaceae bacterium]|nr:PAS domain-containing sensor histidine kinase [Hyphomonadaceae bacterium]
MARQKAKAGKARKTGHGRSRPSLSLTKALGLIILIEGVALGLKAYDDRQRMLEAKQVETHREALAVSERISGKVATVEQTLRLGYQAGWSPAQTARSLADIDLSATMADALTARDGSRLRAAGEKASELLASNEIAGLAQSGDLIIVYDPESGSSRLAAIEASKWLPETIGARSLALQPGRFDSGQVLSARDVSACSSIAGANLSVCVRTQFPLMSRSAMIDLVIYALLLLGPALAILGLFRLFEQRRVESEAFEGEATRAGRILKTVLHQSRAGFWSWDFKTERFELSEEAAKLLGLKGETDISKDEFMSLVHQDQFEAVEQSLETLQERGFLRQVFANKDKSVWLDMRAEPDETQGALNGVLRDVTETKVALARTRQAENRLRSALEGFSGPFALWDRRKRLIYWNRAFVRVFGLEPTVRAGMGYDTVMLSQAANVLERRPNDRDDKAEIIKIRDGQWFKIVERATQSGGLITMGLDVSSDVRNEVELTRQQAKLRKLVAELERSETKTAELTRNLQKEKQNAERSANSKSAFLANMSHELRTPLNAINGFSEILVDEMYGPLGDERYKEYAQDILASGKHLLDMITDILDMAKIEAGKMTVELQPIDITDPVDAAVRMIRRRAEEKGIQLRLVANPGLPLVEADHRAIRQMILNLVSNAIKFTDEGGEIRVTVDQKENELRVAVRDNGIGIPADALPRLGQPFEQVSDTRDRNYDGTGLGLALTKSFAEMHGGRLIIASEAGRGTQVSFFLPVPAHQTKSSSSVA